MLELYIWLTLPNLVSPIYMCLVLNMNQSLGAYMMSLVRLFLSIFQHGIRAAIREAFMSSCSIHDYNFMPYKIDL